MTRRGTDREAPHLPGLAAEFEFVRELGRGGTAVVYLAIERELDRPVAIKVIHPALAADEETVQRLVREARTLAQLNHPNIITLYGVRRLEDGRLALIMQYAGAETLRARLRASGPVDFTSAANLLRDIAGALGHAHRHRIVHRDIKPENIYLNAITGSAHLSDFGIARIWDHDTGLTLGGTAIGTPTYMSPEQIDGAEFDGRSDLYSLGLIGWEMLSGRRPWDGENLYSTIYKQKHEFLPPLAELRPGIPDPLRVAIETALAKSPGDRWPDAESFCRQLDGASRDSSATTAGSGPALPITRTTPPPFAQVERDASTGDLPTVRFRRDTDDLEEAAAAAPPRYEPRHSGEAAAKRRRRNRQRLAYITLGILALGGSLGAVTQAYWRAPPTMVMEPAALPDEIAPEPAPWLDSPSTMVVQDSTSAEPLEIDVALPIPVRLVAIRGARLEGPPLGPLAETIIVRAEAADGQPVEGVAVHFQMLEGGGALRGQSLETDARGLVYATWTLGPAEELNVAVATIDGRPEVRARLEAESRRPQFAPRPTLAAGDAHNCVLTGTGQLSCWGANDKGQTGTGAGPRLTPTRVTTPGTFVTVTTGATHTCALDVTGHAFCWGANDRGQLGDGLREARSAPTAVAGEIGFATMAAGLAHTCALTYHGAAYCWGANDSGQLGDGTYLNRVRPTAAAGPLTFRSLAAGREHTCAVTREGTAYCWGQNRYGQIGDGTSTFRAMPSAVSAGPLRANTLAAGGGHTCAIGDAGPLYCWGRNDAGQLGTGDQANRQAPTLVPLDRFLVQVSAGDLHTCGLTAEGQAYCWGRNDNGQLGDGTTTDRPYPTPVADAPQFITIQARGAHTCATTISRDTYCWGLNSAGQLGDGTRADGLRPAMVQSNTVLP